MKFKVQHATVPLNEIEKHLFHELRMLLGAQRLVFLTESLKFGNTVNYFKDSIFLHARELYHFLLSAPNEGDYSIRQIEDSATWSQLSSNLWEDVEKPLNKYVFHITNSRTLRDVSNMIRGRHISLWATDIVDDIIRLWQEWQKRTQNTDLEVWLSKNLHKARKQAQDDYENSIQKIQDKKK